MAIIITTFFSIVSTLTSLLVGRVETIEGAYFFSASYYLKYINP
jgi:hypothetical protein